MTISDLFIRRRVPVTAGAAARPQPPLADAEAAVLAQVRRFHPWDPRREQLQRHFTLCCGLICEGADILLTHSLSIWRLVLHSGAFVAPALVWQHWVPALALKVAADASMDLGLLGFQTLYHLTHRNQTNVGSAAYVASFCCGAALAAPFTFSLQFWAAQVAAGNSGFRPQALLLAGPRQLLSTLRIHRNHVIFIVALHAACSLTTRLLSSIFAQAFRKDMERERPKELQSTSFIPWRDTMLVDLWVNAAADMLTSGISTLPLTFSMMILVDEATLANSSHSQPSSTSAFLTAVALWAAEHMVRYMLIGLHEVAVTVAADAFNTSHPSDVSPTASTAERPGSATSPVSPPYMGESEA